MGSVGYGRRGFPLLLERDQFRGNESFLEKELKYARRWLYSKGVLLPNEDRHPVELQMEDFFECCRTGATPKAGLEVGLANAAAVVLSNLAMDEERRVRFDEIDSIAAKERRPARPRGEPSRPQSAAGSSRQGGI
jgi:hypothetical protein